MQRLQHLSGRPLLLHGMAAVGGIMAVDRLSDSSAVFALLTLTGLVLAGWLWKRGGTVCLVLLTGLVFGMLHSATLQGSRDHPIREALHRPGTNLEVVAEGRILKPLRGDMPGAEPGEALFVAERIASPRLGKEWHGATCVKLYPGRGTALAPGHYRIHGRLRLPPPADNPGQFDVRDYNLRLGLVADLGASRTECLREERWNLSAFLMHAAEHCRARISEMLAVDLADRPDERTIILAMALGSIGEEGKDLEKPFRDSGTLHIFAVSGLHVAIVGVVLWAFLRPFGWRRGVMVALLIPALFGYAFLTGLRPSAVRAAFMASVLLIGMACNRRTDLLNSLGAAALVLLVVDTQQVFSPGFQLSFGVIAAIAVFASAFTAPLRPWIDPDPFLPKPLLSGWQKSLWSARRWFASLFTVSAAATLGSLPLMFGHFHLLTPVSLMANAVLVPLSFLVLFTAMLTLLCSALHIPLVPALLSNANLAFAWCTLHSAEGFAAIPGGNFYLQDLIPGQRPAMELTVLRLPGGAAAQHLRVRRQHWLLDSGSEEHFPFLVLPCLQHLGVNHLDGLLLSHSDYEHVGAALRIEKEFRQPPVWQPAREPWPWETGDSSFRRLRGHGLRAAPLRGGEALDIGSTPASAALATVLYPQDEIWPRRSDDRALVLRLDLGPFRVLWCNDAGFLAEKTMLETLEPEALRSDVIIRNQHAADFSLLPEFLDAVRPRVVVSSNDDFPPEEKLSARVRAACSKRGIALVDQRETGAVTLRFWPSMLELQSMRGAEPLVIQARTGPSRPEK